MNNKTAEYKKTDFNIKHSDIKDAPVCGDVKSNQQPLHTVWQKEKLDFTRQG